MLLEIKDIHTYYGESYIIQGISLEIKKGHVITLLGRNGAGKSTTLKSVMGLVPPKRGSIKYNGREITGLQAFEIVRLGIGYVPEDRRIFGTLTVLENLQIAIKRKEGYWDLNKIFELFPNLYSRKNNWGNQLSGGEQQMLAIARCLLGNPHVILLDEPSEGLAPVIVKSISETIRDLREENMTVLLVEQNVLMTLELADYHYIIDSGKMLYEGSNDDLKGNEEIQKKYLSI